MQWTMQSEMEWVEEFVGIPFVAGGRERDGADCFGLARIVLAERFGIELPEALWIEGSDAPAAEVIEHLEAEAAGAWRSVEFGEARPGDLAMIWRRGMRWHVGVVVGGGLMLHSMEGIGSYCEKYAGAKWGAKVAGILRFEGTKRSA